MNGKVKWFDDKKGFGFILGENDKEYFCHQSDIIMKGYRTLAQDDQVTFDIIKRDRGPAASNIRPI